VYARALGAGFFSDDYEWLGPHDAALERPCMSFRVFYRDFNPVLHLSFVLDYLLGEERPVFHATSLLLTRRPRRWSSFSARVWPECLGRSARGFSGHGRPHLRSRHLAGGPRPALPRCSSSRDSSS